jgi:hypothetical protein
VHTPKVYLDSQNIIALTANPKYNFQSKHVDTQYHFIHEIVQFHHIQLEYVSIEDMPTYIFTKSLFITKHYHCLQKIGMVVTPFGFQLFLAIESLVFLFDTIETSQTQLPTVPHIQAFMVHVEGFLKSYKLSSKR